MKLDTRILEDSGNFTFVSDEDSNSLDYYPFSIAALLKVYLLWINLQTFIFVALSIFYDVLLLPV